MLLSLILGLAGRPVCLIRVEVLAGYICVEVLYYGLQFLSAFVLM